MDNGTHRAFGTTLSRVSGEVWRPALPGDGNGNGRNVDAECADGEESDDGFGEHHDEECRKREQMTTAPGLKFGSLEKGTGESCTAAEGTRESASNLLYTLGTVGRGHGLSSFSLPLTHNIIRPIGGRVYPNDEHAAENQIRNSLVATVGENGQVLSDKIWEVRVTDVLPKIIQIPGVFCS